MMYSTYFRYILNRSRTLLLAALSALAATSPLTALAIPHLTNHIASPTLQKFLEDVMTIVIRIGVVVLVVGLTVSGYLFVMAQGNETELKKAKTAFTWTVIGGAILLGAWLIAKAVGATIGALTA